MSTKYRLLLGNAVLWAAIVVATAIVLEGSGYSTRMVLLLASAAVATLLPNLFIVRRITEP